ncbi:MAG: sigma 54-interacting transcriptional regulator, partial [Myxococcota bacterium]
MAIIDEQSLPARPLEAEVVLHVRNLLYRQLRTEPTGAALGLLFGLSEEECARFDVDRAVRSRNPVATLAEAIAKSRESERAVVSLPSDGDYVEQCRQWLLHRKNEAPRVFDSIVATDLATLLALSRARDAATTADLLGGEDLPEVPILITGETGTGKELLARAIHTLWVAADPARRGRALEILFVAGMSRDQVNDEIFGHIR